MIGLSSARYLAAALGLATGPLMARALGPAGRGELASVVVYAAVVSAVASLGIPVAISHAMAKRLYPPPAILGTAVRFSAVLIGPCLVIAFAVVRWPLAGLSNFGRVGAFIAVSLVPIAVLNSCLTFFLLGEGALRSVTMLQVVPILALSLATFLLYITGWLTLAAAIAVTLGAGVLGAAVGWRAVGLWPSGRVPLKPILNYGLRGFAGNVATFASISLDQLIIGPVLGARELGFYAVAASVASLPYVAGVAIGSRAFAEVASAGPGTVGMTAWRFMRLTLIVTLAVALTVGILGPLLLPVLYGRRFEPSSVPLLILLPGNVALSMSATAATCLNATGRPGRSTIAELSGFFITVVGLALIIPRYGLIGAATLSTAAYSTSLVLYLRFLHSLGPMDLRPTGDDIGVLRAALRHTVTSLSVRRATRRL